MRLHLGWAKSLIVNRDLVDGAGEEIAPTHPRSANGPLRPGYQQCTLRIGNGGDLSTVAIEIPVRVVISSHEVNPSVGTAQITCGNRRRCAVEGKPVGGAHRVIGSAIDPQKDLIAAQLRTAQHNRE